MSYCLPQAPSKKLSMAYRRIASSNLRAIEASMNNMATYAGLNFDEAKEVHQTLFNGFRRNLKIHNHFDRLLKR